MSSELLFQSITIDHIVRLVEALSWPLAAIVIFLCLRPWRLVNHLLDQGGSIKAGGIQLNLAAKILDAEDSIRGGNGATVPPADRRSLTVADDEENAAAIDAYSLIVSSWSALVSTLDNALEALEVGNRDWRSPASLLKQLRDHGVLTTGLHRAASDLLDVRNQVKRNGRDKFDGLGISSSDAERYSGSTVTIRAAVDGWLSERQQQVGP